MKKINPRTGRLNVKTTPHSQTLLPGRRALNQLQKGTPWERSIGNYAKLAPSGANGPMTYQDILDMAENVTKVGS